MFDPIRGDPHLPWHAVGVADLPGELGDQPLPLLRRHRGDLVRDAVLAHRRPTRNDVAGLHRPRAGRNGRGGPRRRRWRERLRDVVGGIGVRGPERSSASMICRASSSARITSMSRATEASPPDSATSSAEGPASNRHRTVVGDVEPLGFRGANRRQHVGACRRDLLGAVTSGDGRGDHHARYARRRRQQCTFARSRAASAVGAGPEYRWVIAHDGVDVSGQTPRRLIPAVGQPPQ